MGLIFGLVIGVIMSLLALKFSLYDALMAFGVSMFMVTAFISWLYYEESNSIPKEIYIKCKVKKGLFSYNGDVTFNGNVGGTEEESNNIIANSTKLSNATVNELTDVHESLVIVDRDPREGEEADGYLRVERFTKSAKSGLLCIRAGDRHSNPRLFTVNVPQSEIAII